MCLCQSVMYTAAIERIPAQPCVVNELSLNYVPGANTSCSILFLILPPSLRLLPVLLLLLPLPFYFLLPPCSALLRPPPPPRPLFVASLTVYPACFRCFFNGVSFTCKHPGSLAKACCPFISKQRRSNKGASVKLEQNYPDCIQEESLSANAAWVPEVQRWPVTCC